MALTSAAEMCGGERLTGPSGVSQPAAASNDPVPATAKPPDSETSPSPTPSTDVVSLVPVIAGAQVDEHLLITVDAASPLSTVGGVALAQTLFDGIYRDVLLARIDVNVFSALNAICSHEGCIVSRVAYPHFVCPCHGSRYDLTGRVVQGPAPAALPRYPVQYRDPVLSVEISGRENH